MNVTSRSSGLAGGALAFPHALLVASDRETQDGDASRRLAAGLEALGFATTPMVRRGDSDEDRLVSMLSDPATMLDAVVALDADSLIHVHPVLVSHHNSAVRLLVVTDVAAFAWRLAHAARLADVVVATVDTAPIVVTLALRPPMVTLTSAWSLGEAFDVARRNRNGVLGDDAP